METPTAQEREITVADLDALVVEYFDLQQNEKVEAEAALTAVNIHIAKIEAKLVMFLKALKRKNYTHPRGTVGIKPQWRVGMPQTDADKAALFGWLRERGVFDRYATVNAQSLNSLWNAEREAAIKEDPMAAVTFNLPGLPAPKLYEGLSKRKGKEE